MTRVARSTPAKTGTVVCTGPGRISAVGPNEAKYTGHSGDLYAKPPDTYSIAGGAMGTVAVPLNFLGLDNATLKQYGGQIVFSFADSGAIVRSRGPSGPYTVSDIGDEYIRNLRFDLYRWNTDEDTKAFGLRLYVITVSFPAVTGSV